MTYEELVRQLIALRKAQKLTLEQVANKMNTSANQVWRLEKGKVRQCRRGTLQRWCKALGYQYYYKLERL